jgi:predicted nucleotidyltransferase
MSVSSASNLLTRSQIIAVLTENYADLAQQFSVASLALFGSYARDEQTPQSDVDLLVTFSRPMGFGFMHLADRLEALLGKRVDLLAADGIKPNRRNSIFASLIHVAP